MKLSRYLLPTLKETPKEAPSTQTAGRDAISARLMLRAGMIRKAASGIYEWLPLGLRVLKKVEEIVREEMNGVGGQEILLPFIQPKEYWEVSGRWNLYGKELLRFKDRKEAEFCLAPTAEELITDLVRREVRSYKELPLLLYQFGLKFRDEIRPRFGVMRAREFLMKDAYSFHATDEEAQDTYQRVYQAYERIFKRCGLTFRAVEAETGAIGGSFSHEFMVLAETGEEEIAHCECGYAANAERAECGEKSEIRNPKSEMLPLQDVPTPGKFSVEDVANLLKAPKEQFIKTMFYVADDVPVVALIRGDTELNEAKLSRALGCKRLSRADDAAYQRVAGCAVGFAGPIGMDKKNGIRVVADALLKTLKNGISGANKKDFHTLNINLGRDYEPHAFYDLHRAKSGDLCGRCGKTFEFARGIEVGHAFALGTKYSEAMKASFLDTDGKEKPFIMGCYGIGVSRVVAAAIEQNHDEAGILWPLSLAPFQAVIFSVRQEPALLSRCEKLYRLLREADVEVLWDDREKSVGVKFKDADLIGIPFRILISEKHPDGKAEIKRRTSATAEILSFPEIVTLIKKA